MFVLFSFTSLYLDLEGDGLGLGTACLMFSASVLLKCSLLCWLTHIPIPPVASSETMHVITVWHYGPVQKGWFLDLYRISVGLVHTREWWCNCLSGQQTIRAESVYRTAAVTSVVVVRCYFSAACVCLHCACCFIRFYMPPSATSSVFRLPTVWLMSITSSTRSLPVIITIPDYLCLSTFIACHK